MKAEQYLQRLKAEQTKLACSTLERPAGRDAFEYGRAVGIYAGLQMAEQVLLDMLADKERKDFNL